MPPYLSSTGFWLLLYRKKKFKKVENTAFPLKNKILISFLITVVSIFNGYTQTVYPEIKTLQVTDALFVQYCDDVLYARKALAAGKTGKDLPFRFYLYTVKKEDSLLKIAARCSIPYDSIVTLNRIESVETDITGKTLILPALPAVYLPDTPKSSIEKLNAALFEKYRAEPVKLNIYSQTGLDTSYATENKREVICFPNEVFDGTVRAFFFKPFYRFPLKDGILTSGFGERASPFTGTKSYHPGIDLAAPTGSPVMACASGKIKSISYSNIYGNHIIISHTDGRESLYGHLSKVYVSLNESIKSGTIIGAVGSTGMSTGPHLHFEIREHGIPKNPVKYIEKGRK